ncbi:MAG: hypothetical protein KIT57_23340 [Blastocatellales bacterium]|nr:hypothetical protein [Blastocatellales bacterium]
MLPTNDQLDQISHAELVAMVKALISRVESLETENRELKAEIERLKQPPADQRQIHGIHHSPRLGIKRATPSRIGQRKSTGRHSAISDQPGN